MPFPAEAPPAPDRRLVGGLAASGGAVGAAVSWFGWTTPAFVVFGVALGALAAHDATTTRIPNRLLYPASAATLALLVLSAVATGGPLGRAVLAALLSFSLLLVVALVAPAGMGMGDVKLAALVGLVLGWAGWGTLLGGLLLAFVANAVVGLVARWRSGRVAVPLAPFLAAASAVVLLVDCGVGGCR